MDKTIYKKAYKKMLGRLRAAREELGLRQGDVAAKLKCTQSYVSKIERGQIRLDIIQLKDFAKLYKKTILHFID